MKIPFFYFRLLVLYFINFMLFSHLAYSADAGAADEPSKPDQLICFVGTQETSYDLEDRVFFPKSLIHRIEYPFLNALLNTKESGSFMVGEHKFTHEDGRQSKCTRLNNVSTLTLRLVANWVYSKGSLTTKSVPEKWEIEHRTLVEEVGYLGFSDLATYLRGFCQEGETCLTEYEQKRMPVELNKLAADENGETRIEFIFDGTTIKTLKRSSDKKAKKTMKLWYGQGGFKAAKKIFEPFNPITRFNFFKGLAKTLTKKNLKLIKFNQNSITCSKTTSEQEQLPDELMEILDNSFL